MCGICGNLNFTKQHHIDTIQLKRMVMALRHRGPDELGIYRDKHIGLGHARLGIIDLKGGQQPIHNEDKSLWITYNGEIFNYIELKESLAAQGHRFYTRTDTEVILHLYEQYGMDFLQHLNGQFALAIWDVVNQRLVLARDRLGIRPLYYTVIDGSFLFASEVKALFIDKRVRRQIDVRGLDQLFTFWSTISPRTVFSDIMELPAGHFMVVENKNVTTKRYWQLDFYAPDNTVSNKSEDKCAEQLLSLLIDATRIRLRADVSVAAYLSGGLDSSFICALVKKYFNNKLKTFSVAFSDADYDEAKFQQEMADYLGTSHSSITCNYTDIARIIPEVVWYAEKPLIRTAAAPMYLLSRLVRKHKIKVVLTGEGSDEILGGYDLFREAKIRRFWAKFPDSKFRPLLMRKLYSYIPNWPRSTSAFLEEFYRAHLLKRDDKCYSHIPRWETTSRIKALFSKEVKAQLANCNTLQEFQADMPEHFNHWDHLSQAQYIEIITLLEGNLLSSQGDRMMMAHAVEGRLPFLDYRVVEFCAKLDPQMKLKVLNEKYLLKKIAADYLPDRILARKKQAYRAPDALSFFKGKKFSYIEELLSVDNLSKTGYFDPDMVVQLVKKCKSSNTAQLSAKDNMAIVAVITTLLLHKQFIGS